MRKTATNPSGVIFPFFLISAFVGFLIGLVEASLLWTTPRVIPLLQPDVGYVIWFLAPLVDMIFFGLVGVLLGWIARRTARKEVFVAVEAGIVITFVVLVLKWLHLEIGLHPFRLGMEVLVPLMYFAMGFAVSLMLFTVAWERVASFSERWVRALMKPLTWGLVAATVVAVAGIGLFCARPRFLANAAQRAAPPSGAPNIVFITLDAVRPDHLSAYGYSRSTTPNLDRFARTGVLFENAIAPTSWTLASHASMFTGLLPQQHGADWAVPLSSRPWTLADILRSQGYRTAGVVGNVLYLERGWGIGHGLETYEDYSYSLKHNLSETLIGNAVVQPLYQSLWSYDWIERRNAADINARVFRWLRRRPAVPYFLFINYLDAHDPYLTAMPYNRRFGLLPMALVKELRFSVLGTGHPPKLTLQERKLLVDGYDNCLSYLDDQVGRLLKFLHRTTGWQNTIVIITSDHGEEFGEHGHYTHGFDLYRQLLHVPLIMAGPGIPQGVRVSQVVGTRQLFSTVLDLAGHGNTPFSRTSLARFWKPGFRPTPSNEAVLSELVPSGYFNGQRAMMSLTTPRWQYIEHRSGRQELYQWTTDPEEKDDLAGSPQDQDALDRLRSRLLGLVSHATGPWRGRPYLQALENAAGSSHVNLFFPQPLQPGAAGNRFRIGIAQAYFKSQEESTPVRPSKSERDTLRSLPYQ